jgi:hypothetical protein
MAKWENEWIEAAHQIVQDEYIRSYAEADLEDSNDAEESSTTAVCPLRASVY